MVCVLRGRGECQTGGAIDDEELEDVDLFQITDPTSPVLLAETELPDVHINGYGHNKTSHDFRLSTGAPVGASQGRY
jgi:hypothetical protein